MQLCMREWEWTSKNETQNLKCYFGINYACSSESQIGQFAHDWSLWSLFYHIIILKVIYTEMFTGSILTVFITSLIALLLLLLLLEKFINSVCRDKNQQ